MITHRDLAEPKSIQRPFSEPGWVFELKYDGFRALASNEGDTTVSLVARNGANLLSCFPEIEDHLKLLPPLVLDGELVVLDERGHPQLERLRRRFAMKYGPSIQRFSILEPAAYFAFDLLSIGDRDVRKLPLERRKGILKDALKGSERVRYLDHVEEEGERLYAAAVRLGMEGVVAKPAKSAYRRSYESGWLMIKTAAGLASDAERRK